MAETNENQKGSWLTSAAPLIGAGLDAVGGIFGSLFNANQAKKNRQFQERMYQRQLEDNRANWRMANEYNLPSAQLQRLEDAGLNPLLMYEGGTSLTSSSTAQGASAPSGSSASSDMRTNFTSAATQSALIRAQIANINADTEQKEAAAEQSKSTTSNLEQDLLFKRLSQQVELDLKHGNLRHLEASINNLVAQTLNTNEMTFQTALTMRQAREYEIKRFDLDFTAIGNQYDLGLKQIANDRERVNQGWRDLGLRWLELKNNIRWTSEQIGALRWNVLKDKAMFTPQFQSLKLDVQLKRWDSLLKASDFNYKQVETFNMMLKNYYLQNVGSESISPVNVPAWLWHGSNKPKLQDMFLFPKLHL